MTTHSNLRTGGQILADQLQIHGVDMAFGVPGESYLGLLDALYDTPDPLRHLPPGRWCGDDGRGLRQAHRPARHRDGDARAGRHQRLATACTSRARIRRR